MGRANRSYVVAEERTSAPIVRSGSTSPHVELAIGDGEGHTRRHNALVPKKSLDAALGAAYDGSLDQQVAAIPSLIAHLGHEDADLALIYLLQHPWDTWPILAAGRLLLSDGSDQALRLFAVAWHLTHLAEEWSSADTLCDAARGGEGSGINVVRWASLAEGSSPAARAGAQSICEWLTGVEELPG